MKGIRLRLVGAAIGGLSILIVLVVISGVRHSSDHAPHVLETPPPPDTDDLVTLGDYYFNTGEAVNGAYDLRAARRYYTEAIAASSTGHAHQWYQLGRIDFLEGKFSQALHKFDRQIEYFGDELPNVYYMIGLTHGYKARQTNSADEWEAAAAAFETYITYSPTAPWSRVDLAWVYFAQGSYEDMIQPLEEGLKYHPDHAWLLNMYGLALLNTDRKAEAIDVFTKAEMEAAKLTVADWGRAYPGNNPADWAQGLEEFRGAIAKNLELASS